MKWNAKWIKPVQEHQDIAPVFLRKFSVKKELKQLDYQYDGNRPEKICTVDGLGITCRLPNEEKSIAFADALAVYELKRSIVVASIDSAIVLDKGGFADGQMEACLAHIKKCCPNCPHYKR